MGGCYNIPSRRPISNEHPQPRYGFTWAYRSRNMIVQQTMNYSIIVAVVVVGGMPGARTLAGPALLDFPGPGYREQAGLITPSKELRDAPTPFRIRKPSPQTPPAPLDGRNPFARPIRLFGAPIGGAGFDFTDPERIDPKRW